MDETKLPPTSSTPFSPELSSEVAELRAQVAALTARVQALEQQPNSQLTRPVIEPKLESRFGLTLVNRAGSITLAIGLIFFFKYAADNRWIGPEGRVVIGLLFGIALLGAAEWLRRREAAITVFAQGIAGCGLAIVYAAVYASFGYYNLLVPAAGWLFLVLVSVLAVVLSMRYASPAMAALGFAGGLLTPILLHNSATSWWLDFVYLLLLGTTALHLAARRTWPALIPLLAPLTLIAAAVCFESAHAGWFVVFALVLAAAHFAAAKRSGILGYLTGHGLLVLGAMRWVALWADAHSKLADRFSAISSLESFLLGIYGLILLLYAIWRSSSINRSLGLFLLGLLIAKLYLWDVWQLSRFYRIGAFVALGALLLAASYLYSRFRSRTSE